MFWYLFLAAFPIIVSSIETICFEKSINKNVKTKRQFLFLCGIVMFLIIALRNRYIGSVDSENYFNNWERLSNVSFGMIESIAESTKMERGYLAYVWLFSQVFSSGQFAFVFSGLLFTISVCRFIYKNSENVQLSFVMFICLGLYSFMVQGLRQAMAMSICLFAIEFCKKRQFVPFILVVLLATMFHKSAIVFIIIYFIYGFKMNVRTGLVSSCIAAGLLILSPQIAVLGNMVFEREYEESVESGGFVAVAIYVLILFFSIVFAGERRKEKDYSFFVFMTLIGAVFYLMRYSEVRIAERISFYFMFGQIIALPNAISQFDKHVGFIIRAAVTVLSVFLFIYRLNGEGLLVYSFFWQ